MNRENLMAELDTRLFALDENYAQATIAGLSTLLAAGLATAHPAIGNLCVELLQKIQQYGSSGAWRVTARGYPAVSATSPARQAIQDALQLRAGRPALGYLAAMLAFYGEISTEDYPREVVVAALLEAAHPPRDYALDDELDAIELRRMEVPASTSRRAQQSSTFYEVVAGDTIEDVAQGIFGARDRWPDVVKMYELVAPYVQEFGAADGVLRPGERLMLPAAQERSIRIGGGLGDTLALSNIDGLRVDLTLTESGDLALASGLAGFASDIALRAMTPLGDVAAEPEYGVLPVAGERADSEGLIRALMLNESLYHDSRVGQIKSTAEAGTSARLGVVVDQVVVLPRPNIMEG